MTALPTHQLKMVLKSSLSPPSTGKGIKGQFSNSGPRSIYQYSYMAPGLSGQNCKFFLSSFCHSIPQKNLNTKKTIPNIEVCPESLGAMLEY